MIDPIVSRSSNIDDNLNLNALRNFEEKETGFSFETFAN